MNPSKLVGLLVLAICVIGASGIENRSRPDRNPPVSQFLENGIEWLAAAQFQNGGWGAGSHQHQEIRDPKAVQIDPATTAFAAMALMRAGSTLKQGPHASNVSKALDYLLHVVEESPEEGANITSLTSTQPQVKMGQNIDVATCAQFFSRVLPHTKKDKALCKRVEVALDKCLRKVARGQSADGSIAGAGWAGVLQSAMAHSALEAGQAAGRDIDDRALERSREYQKGNLDAKTGTVRTEGAAGVELYSITSNQRATAAEASEAKKKVNEAKRKGDLPAEAPVSKSSLQKIGLGNKEADRLANAYEQNQAGKRMLDDERVLSGFGNNGGEEYLSYMMTAESMVITSDNNWKSWQQKMGRRFEKIQDGNGSWSGHHCITSPVFCTAAVIMTLTADHDAEVLMSEQERNDK